MYQRILKLAFIAVAQFGVLVVVAQAQAARGTSTTVGHPAIVGSSGPAAILALPPASGPTQRTQTTNTSSKSGSSAKIMPVRRPGTIGR